MKPVIIFCLLASISMFANAGQIVDMSTFLSRVTVASVETFDGVAPEGSSKNIDGGTTDRITYSGGYAFAVDPSFDPIYQWGSGTVGLLRPGGPETLTFSSPVTAFSAEIGTIPRFGRPVKITIGNDSFTLPTNSNQTLVFFGYTSDTLFDAVSFSTAPFVFPIIDNITLGITQVPEPASLTLFGLGLIVLISARRISARVKVLG